MIMLWYNASSMLTQNEYLVYVWKKTSYRSVSKKWEESMLFCIPALNQLLWTPYNRQQFQLIICLVNHTTRDTISMTSSVIYHSTISSSLERLICCRKSKRNCSGHNSPEVMLKDTCYLQLRNNHSCGSNHSASISLDSGTGHHSSNHYIPKCASIWHSSSIPVLTAVLYSVFVSMCVGDVEWMSIVLLQACLASRNWSGQIPHLPLLLMS